MDITSLKHYFQSRLKVKTANLTIDKLLSLETRTFLQTVGLPDDEELGFAFDENLILLPNGLIKLEPDNERALCLDLYQNEAVCWSNAADDFINSSVQQFVICVYELEHCYTEMIAKKTFGDYYGKTNGKPNWLAYASYLDSRIRAVDPAVFEKGYYWPAFIERIEQGI